METLRFDLSKKEGAFKVLNATNGGPWHKRHASDQFRSNFEDYKAARIPYSRNHDSGVIGIYGGPYSHDITNIFPNFDADENDPESYDFACTDESILTTLDAGTETFFRLGQTIEHQIKKHGTIPPKDFNKWARICEHIIRHYNYGWADGFELNIQYWEIWNEPDLDADDSPNKRTWGGTKAQFFDMYEIAAKHLKSCFPELKIGGPALAGAVTWADDFLKEMSERNVPIDFFSWHVYGTTPQKMLEKAGNLKELLVKYGYENAESILNEWNYVRGWREDFKYSILAIHGLKGAAFVMSCICEAQKSNAIDMLMYYDTRPGAFCGAFDYYSYEPLKGYYPLMWYGKFYDMESEIRCENEPENIYTLCGTDKDDKVLCIVTNYSEDDDSPEIKVKVDFGKEGKYEIYAVDEEHSGELINTTDNLEIAIPRQSFILIKEI
ncbi:MAG: hypothetical protein IKW02_02740 [Clostridia bacterium]|nr:hypothetical protein [Clostridia bacterium]